MKLLQFVMAAAICVFVSNASAQDLRKGGSSFGKVESNGDVRINGSVKGKIESNGDIRKNGSVVGSAKGVKKEQAAVIFFFEFFDI